jgi:anthranilate phosphoribosyltransferase
MIRQATQKLESLKDLSQLEMQAVMEEIAQGKAQTESIVSFLTALSNKGETVEELSAAVSVMRRHAIKINADEDIILDTCGTGGDKSGTFNVSTVVAFVASGCGITVAKHGNRSVSSVSGSADILEALGVNINLTKEQMERCLKAAQIAFLFAPSLHPAMKYAMPARKQIGKRTIFNVLGPLINPAQATHQLIGVFEKGLTDKMAQVLKNLGTVHALVVYGMDGLDEVTIANRTLIADLVKGKIKNYEISPQDFGLKTAPLESIKGGTAQENAQILIKILEGGSGPCRDMVLLNAGCAVYAADKTATIKEGIEFARASIDSGKAREKLEMLKKCSNQN